MIGIQVNINEHGKSRYRHQISLDPVVAPVTERDKHR